MDHIALLSARVIAYRPILRSLGIASTAAGTLLASQLLWEYEQHGRQSFAITDKELAERVGLTVDEVRTARQDITSGSEPCFSYRRRGFPPLGYWDVNREALAARLSAKSQCSSQFGPEPEQASSQFGPGPELKASIRVSSRIEEKPVTTPIRLSSRIEAPGSNPSQGSNSGQSPHQFGPAPESSIYENDLEELKPEKTKSPPLPPAGGAADAALTDRVEGSVRVDGGGEQPAAPKGTRAGSTLRAQRVDPTTAELPVLLEPHRQAIADFWAAKRRGSAKTAAAFRLLIEQLEQIQAADASAVAQQLNAATQSGWSSITFQNWQRYGRETQKTGNGSRFELIGGSRQSDNAARVIAGIRSGSDSSPWAEALARQEQRVLDRLAIDVEVLP